MNYETITIDDCLDNWKKKDNGVILEHGHVTEFEKDKEGGKHDGNADCYNRR